jgi:hypothetical protein
MFRRLSHEEQSGHVPLKPPPQTRRQAIEKRQRRFQMGPGVGPRPAAAEHRDASCLGMAGQRYTRQAGDDAMEACRHAERDPAEHPRAR